jgi:hypothetical protein
MYVISYNSPLNGLIYICMSYSYFLLHKYYCSITTNLQSTTQKTKDGAIRTPLNPGLNSCAPKEETIPAPLMAPVVLL